MKKMKEYGVEVYTDDNDLMESMDFTYKEEAEQVADALENLTDYQIIRSWEKYE